VVDNIFIHQIVAFHLFDPNVNYSIFRPFETIAVVAGVIERRIGFAELLRLLHEQQRVEDFVVVAVVQFDFDLVFEEHVEGHVAVHVVPGHDLFHVAFVDASHRDGFARIDFVPGGATVLGVHDDLIGFGVIAAGLEASDRQYQRQEHEQRTEIGPTDPAEDVERRHRDPDGYGAESDGHVERRVEPVAARHEGVVPGMEASQYRDREKKTGNNLEQIHNYCGFV